MRGIFTGMLVLGLLFIITSMKFTTLHIRACESFTALMNSTVISSKCQLMFKWMDQVWTPWCMYLWSINRRSLHYLRYNCWKAHPSLASTSWQIKKWAITAQSIRDQCILNPGNGNKTLEQNDSCIVVIHPVEKVAVLAITYSLRIKLDLKQFQKTQWIVS